MGSNPTKMAFFLVFSFFRTSDHLILFQPFISGTWAGETEKWNIFKLKTENGKKKWKKYRKGNCTLENLVGREEGLLGERKGFFVEENYGIKDIQWGTKEGLTRGQKGFKTVKKRG